MSPSDAVSSQRCAKAAAATWAAWVPLSQGSDAHGRPSPRLGPAGVGAGGHAAPRGSAEISLMISRLGLRNRLLAWGGGGEGSQRACSKQEAEGSQQRLGE